MSSTKNIGNPLGCYAVSTGKELSTFEGSECLHIQDQTVKEKSLTLPVVETPIISYQSARCNVDRPDTSATTMWELKSDLFKNYKHIDHFC